MAPYVSGEFMRCRLEKRLVVATEQLWQDWDWDCQCSRHALHSCPDFLLICTRQAFGSFYVQRMSTRPALVFMRPEAGFALEVLSVAHETGVDRLTVPARNCGAAFG